MTLFLFTLSLGDNVDIMECLGVIYRGLISLATLFLVTKLIGRRQVSELNLFDYVIGLSIGNFAAEITINQEVPLINGLLGIVLYGLVTFILSILSSKSIWIRRKVMGTPILLIEKGVLLEKNLKKTNLDVNEILEMCRGSGYFSLDEIDYAIIEANGKLSILPKAENKPITLKDMKLKGQSSGFVANVVIDGKIMQENLKNMHKTKKWLQQSLKVQGYNELSEILLATLDNQEKLVVYERNLDKKPTNILE